MSRSWLLFLDDLIASAEKIGRLTSGRTIEQFVAEEAVFGHHLGSCEQARAGSAESCVGIARANGRWPGHGHWQRAVDAKQKQNLAATVLLMCARAMPCAAGVGAARASRHRGGAYRPMATARQEARSLGGRSNLKGG